MSISDTAIARDRMQEAFPKERHGSVYAAQYAAFSYLRGALEKSVTFRRARSIWEGTARRIDAEEAEALKRAKYEEAQRARHELTERLSRLDAEIAALRQEVAGRMGNGQGEGRL